MGHSTIFDIVSSTVIAGMLLLITLRLNMQANETSALYNSNLTLQENMSALVGMIEHDFRRIGYCADYTQIPDPSLSIRLADSNAIRFWTDVDNDGVKDSVHYYLGGPDASTINPNDKILYRRVNNGTPQPLQLGVTVFRFRYFNVENDTLSFPISDPREVYTMEITLGIEAPAPFQVVFLQEEAARADFQQFWRQLRLAARNLRNR